MPRRRPSDNKVEEFTYRLTQLIAREKRYGKVEMLGRLAALAELANKWGVPVGEEFKAIVATLFAAFKADRRLSTSDAPAMETQPKTPAGVVIAPLTSAPVSGNVLDEFEE